MADERIDEEYSPAPGLPPPAEDAPKLPPGVGPILRFLGQATITLALGCFGVLLLGMLMGRGSNHAGDQRLLNCLSFALAGLLLTAAGEALIYLRILASRALDRYPSS